MSFTALRIRRKACAPSWKSANPTGKTAEHRPHLFSHSILSHAIFSRALTLHLARLTLKIQFAGKGSGEGRVNRPRSRHCDRLKSRKPGHPPAPQRVCAFREKKHRREPHRNSRGAFSFGPVRPKGAGPMYAAALANHRRFVRQTFTIAGI